MSLLVTTVLFDYPPYSQPTFYERCVAGGILSEDIHVQRYDTAASPPPNGEVNIYSKLTWFKIHKHLEYLKSVSHKYEYTLFLDALDTNFLRRTDRLLREYLSFNCDIVMCAEKGIWPPTPYTHLYDSSPTDSEYRYLNSGCMIGKTKSIISALEEAVNDEFPPYDDQGVWTNLYLLKKADIVLDTEQRLFFSTYLSKHKTLVEKDIPIGIQSSAFIVHDNGPWGNETIKLTDACNSLSLDL